ncbi:MAG: Calx-beta domain-containing protein, partial [Actinomycetota bacterium]
VQVNVQVTNDPLLDVSPVESATILLTGASGATIIEPSSAPLFIVDEDGLTPRVAFGGGDYEEIEGSGQGGIPVFRGGSAGAPTDVTYTITPGSAQPGSDFIASSGTLSFGTNERAKLIPITVLDDLDAEGSESFTVTLSGTGVVEEPSTVTFFIRDNEERIKPTSTLHHPNNRKKYRNTDFRIREVHVFTKDNPGGAGVVDADFALRKNLKRGKCQWWVRGRKFKKGDCDKERWRHMGKFETDFFFIRLDALPPSKGKIKNYTAFSRAIDGAGNGESFLNTGENHNKFEVKPGKS